MCLLLFERIRVQFPAPVPGNSQLPVTPTPGDLMAPHLSACVHAPPSYNIQNKNKSLKKKFDSYVKSDEKCLLEFKLQSFLYINFFFFSELLSCRGDSLKFTEAGLRSLSSEMLASAESR